MRSLLAVAFLLIGVASYAQNNAALSGRIYSSKNGAPVPFATIAVWGTQQGTIANENGEYEIKGLKPGYVQLKVSAVGFKPTISGEVLATNAKRAILDVEMEETSVSIEEITVRANNFRKSIDSPVSLSRIGIEEIEKNPGGNRDISKVIQSFPGVSSAAAFRNDIIVRGGGPSENKFYLDGIEVPTINHFSTQGASGGPVGVINVDFIREVNFYSGAFPSSSNDVLSSILDFKMIDGNKDKLKFRATVGASDLGLTLDGPISDRTTFIASARRSYLQLLFKTLKLPFLPTYNDIQLKVKTKINSKQEISFIGLGAYDISRLNKSISNPDEEQRFILNYLPENDQWSYTLGVVYKQYREKSVNTWVVSRSHFFNKEYKYPSNDESQPRILDYSSAEKRNRLRFEHSNEVSGYKMGYGANVGVDEYSNSTFQLGFKNGAPSTTDYSSSLNLFNYGVFFNIAKSYLNEKLSLALGARLDGNSYSSSMQNPLKQVSPRFSLSYGITKEVFFNFNLGRYYQAPPLTSMGYASANGELVNKRNGLKYIQSDHLVAGFEYRPSEKDKLTLEGFYKLYDNYLFSVTDSVAIASKGGDYGVFGNEELRSTAKGSSYGVELMYRSKDFYGFNLVGAYTLFWSRTKSSVNRSGANGWIPTSWDNRNIVTLTGSRMFGKNWEAGVKWRYLGGSPYTPYDIDKSSIKEAYDAVGGLYFDYSQFNQLRLGSYQQLDLRVDKTYYLKKWSMNFYVDIQNVLASKQKRADVYLPELDANGKPIVVPGNPDRYKLKKVEMKGSGTILPTIGVILDF
ncbi:TonB-dependent receptor [Acetobacteroides hydrogenigenes]|uniref:Outer membrane receptor protein involved in Fe transport n=1 Tax=Acetobacteroides hydrogenigenes TaxID=979970 RepID=A0A4R2E9P2_9BACT|nr:TonB-dependent receptor [Acetobacteroides hydrogenigenes]TCN65408.1 outer membrane receptor protein involved in Fe transport [Acetobacteroides hydrogenigenes]